MAASDCMDTIGTAIRIWQPFKTECDSPISYRNRKGFCYNYAGDCRWLISVGKSEVTWEYSWFKCIPYHDKVLSVIVVWECYWRQGRKTVLDSWRWCLWCLDEAFLHCPANSLILGHLLRTPLITTSLAVNEMSLSKSLCNVPKMGNFVMASFVQVTNNPIHNVHHFIMYSICRLNNFLIDMKDMEELPSLGSEMGYFCSQRNHGHPEQEPSAVDPAGFSSTVHPQDECHLGGATTVFDSANLNRNVCSIREESTNELENFDAHRPHFSPTLQSWMTPYMKRVLPTKRFFLAHHFLANYLFSSLIVVA